MKEESPWEGHTQNQAKSIFLQEVKILNRIFVVYSNNGKLNKHRCYQFLPSGTRNSLASASLNTVES